jgi:beta-N-acetylhexosaminidase
MPPVTAMGEQTSLADRKRAAGQQLILGFEHPHVDDDTRKIIAALQPAGFILFARNVVEPAQVRELNRELASLVDPASPALLSVDQEGGRVQRIREPATPWPPMRTVGQAEVHTAEVATAIATELRAMGFNLNFAPVADVDSNPANPVIGDRAFGRDPAEVARHVRAFVTAHQAAGVIACAKHFPGHGDTHLDSHHALPSVDVDLPELLRRELVPFAAAVQAGVGTLMSAHVIFPALDEDWPATLSPRVIPQLLRAAPGATPREGRGLGFSGVLFSDDMEMKAVHGRWPVDELARRGVAATIDLFLCCRAPTLQLEMFEALVRAQEADAGHAARVRESARRVRALRERFLRDAPPAPSLDALGSLEHRVLAESVRRRGGA